MKKIYTLIIILVFTTLLCSCTVVGDETPDYIISEEKASFDFFWDNTSLKNNLSYGLIADSYPSNGLASIASVGYGLAAIPVGVENGWITAEEGEERALGILSNMGNLEQVNGFFYHFYAEVTGAVAPDSEVSIIDTGIFICGALVAGAYFESEVLEIAMELYDNVNWTWYINPNTNRFYMGYDASTEQFEGAWDVYGEQLLLYFLAAGSNTYSIEKIVYDSFSRNYGIYANQEFIVSWFGSIFTYQYSHAFIDFSNLVDADGVNWYDNSVSASIANYQYSIDNPEQFNTFSELAWGMTACNGPYGYSGDYGAAPNGTGFSANQTNDGTIACSGAIGSIVFTPDLVLPAFENYTTMLDGQLVGQYGLYDSFNLEGDKTNVDGYDAYISKTYIGIDKGITILMIENYRSELIWELFSSLDFMDKAIEVLEFVRTE